MICFFALLAVFFTALPGHAQQVLTPGQTLEKTGFLPHTALYDIKLSSLRSGAQIVNVAGQMYFELRRDCEKKGWQTLYRFNLKYEYPDKGPVRVESEFENFEPINGLRLNFSAQRSRGGEVFEEFEGTARLKTDPEGQISGGVAEFSQPQGLTFDLPANTYFPLAHSAALIEKAREGARFFNATIFDGSDDEGPVNVNAFIGEKTQNPMAVQSTVPKDIDQNMILSPAWRTQLAFFPLNKPDPQADYEMDALFHANGVVSDLHIDYADFSVSQKLRALEFNPPAQSSKDWSAARGKPLCP